MVRLINRHFCRRTAIWLVAILIPLLAALPQQTQAAPGGEALTIGGVATLDRDTDSDGDTTEVDLGGKVQWKVDYKNISGGLLTDVKVNNALGVGQTYVPGSAQPPPGWTTEFSINGGSSYVPQEPASGVTNLRFATNFVAPGTGGQVTSLLPPLLPVSQGTGGDGYIPILAGSRIYAIFHHMPPNVPVLSCIDRTTNQVCSGYPKAIGPYYTSNTPGGGVFFNNRIYFRVQSSTQFGLMCWDSTTNASCGFTPMANLPGATPTQHDRGTGPRAIGNRIFLVTDDHRVHCFDVPTQALCAGYPVNSLLIQANVTPFPNGIQSGFMDMEVDGARIYATVAGPYGGFSGVYLHCFDTATATPCADWAAPVHENDGNYFGLFFRKDSAGVRNGVCMMRGEGGGTPICYDLHGANRALLTQMPPTFPCGFCYYIYSVIGDTEAGSRTIFGSFYASQSQCWDWTINGPCQGPKYSNGIVDHRAALGRDTLDYGVVYDGACVIGLGDTGLMHTFDPVTGIGPCTVTGASATTTVAKANFYCDGATHPAGWDKVRVIDVNLTANVEFRSFIVTVVDADNNVVAGPTDMVGTNGLLDLSGVDAAKTQLTAKVNADAIANGSSYPAWSDGVAPKLALTFDGDPIQACFKTQVVCNNTTPTTVAATSTAALSGVTASAQLSVYSQVPACIDTDGDSAFDNVDTDDDNDGVSDDTEITNGTNPLKPDSDNDGVKDGQDAFPLDPTENADSDSDGVGDQKDNCPNNANTDQANNDSDSQGNACDTDDDNDGTLDATDSEPLAPPYLSVVDASLNLHGLSRFPMSVVLTPNGASVSALNFTLDYDQSCLAFDATTDSNNDGIPNAISDLPAGFVTSSEHQLPNGALKILISPPSNSPSLPTLNAGAIATIAFDVLPGCVVDGAIKDVAFAFTAASFGGDQGHEINGATANATYHLRFNARPTAISLAATNVDEDKAVGTDVGDFDSTDVDEGAPINDSHTYSLVAGPGDTDNASFTMSADHLLTASSFNFEAKSSYSIRVRSTDRFGGTFEQSFTISVNDLNEPPSDLQLDQTHVAENAAASALVGALTTSDEDLAAGGLNEQHSYSLPADQLDNAQFQIVGNQLQAAVSFDHEVRNTYNVRIRTTDSANQFFEKVFTIVVDNVNDRPVATDDPTSPPLVVMGNGNAVTLDVLANDRDQDTLDTLAITRVDNPTTANGAAVIHDKKVDYTAPQHYNGADSFTYTASDANPLGAQSDDAQVSLYVVANDTRGDCNSDGKINAADFPALVLEIFDTDSSLSWWRIFEQGFNGSPRGCDANASENRPSGATPSVQASDITCTVLVFFGMPQCSGEGAVTLAAHTTATATLAIDSGLEAQAGETVGVPIRLSTAGNHVAAATFALAFEGDQLSFDPTDSNSDGLPDTIHFNIPTSMVASVHYNAASSRIEVAVYGVNLPMPLLTDGMLATVNLQVKPDIAVDQAPLTLDLASLGDDAGQTVAVNATNATVQITTPVGGTGADKFIYLPVVTR